MDDNAEPAGGTSRVYRVLRAIGRHVLRGLIHTGSAFSPFTPLYFPTGPHQDSAPPPREPDRPDTSASRHPERMVADKPPTPDEAKLWSQLTGVWPDGKERSG